MMKHYFQADIQEAIRDGISDGSRPDAFITRAEVMAMLNRMKRRTNEFADRYISEMVKLREPAVVRTHCAAGIGSGSIVTSLCSATAWPICLSPTPSMRRGES